MDVEQVRQFVEVMHVGTVSGAAKKLNISQPALSRSLKRLESELGGPLFERGSNSLRPNEQARAALPAAEELVRSAQRMRDDIATSRLKSEMLRIGTVAPAPLWYLTSFVVESLPGTMFRQEMLEEDALEQRVYDGTLDVAIAMRKVPGMRCRLFMRENLYLSAPEGHPLASRSSVSFGDLDYETYILYDTIGFWNGVHERMMPHALFIRQSDRQVFRELMRTTRALGFASDAPVVIYQQHLKSEQDDPVKRVAVPITDPEAHASFYLVARPDLLETNEAVATIMEAVPSLEEESDGSDGSGKS
ncbi:MAG: LysR family transcriptional regulator [Tractidigestivibacter sp.]|jgi:LysR family cyn operon transcriptional activator|uniref:LysR family transcriptional regulator n=1 Tax=Tractidigestivibacter sp. TaxID=2847320 RepID=UPI003D930CDF